MAAKKEDKEVSVFTGKMAEQMAIAKELATSGMVPMSYIAKPGAIFATIQYGAEFGLPPMTALQNIANINGKPSMGADMLIGLAFKHKDFAGYKIIESTDTKCIVSIWRFFPRINEATEFKATFTLDDAKKAGIYDPSKTGSAWNKWRARMLKHRADAFVVRDAFPDVLMGKYSIEEMDPEKAAREEQDWIVADDQMKRAEIAKEDGISEEKPKVKTSTTYRNGRKVSPKVVSE